MTRRRRPAGDDLDALAERLAPRVAALVLSRLATALGAVEAPFSTRKGHEPPEFSGRSRAWREVAPTIPGAVRVGRWWSVSRAAYATWIASQRRPPPTPAATAEWTPADVARDLGLRLVGSRGRA